ncbi:hypothetical protein E2C01_011264 [Portunus trituberculatus]|uniref:Uncharacterized protein n=1 Tax=Portunus trituberculatus TaxID=210409 RepID=A0A5B7DAN2_PORTR|nr:hypothetical protein [Portunus trituberculatus]
MKFAKFLPKFVKGRDSLGRRTGRRWLSGPAWGPRQGTGSRSFFSLAASSFTIVIHLQRLTLCKGSP